MGKWTLAKNELTSDAHGTCKLQIPFQVPVEYDLHVVFSREEGTSGVAVILAAGNRQFAWLMSGYKGVVNGFDRIAGKGPDKNKTGVPANPALENGRKYDLVLKVRKNGVEAWVDGKLYSNWQTDFSEMTLPPTLANNSPNSAPSPTKNSKPS
jgi:hypothetical protein